jgi:hypothetical protein
MIPKKTNESLPEAIILQIAVLAGISSPTQIEQFKLHLKTTVAYFSEHAGSLRIAPSGRVTATASDRKTTRAIFKLTRELERQLANASLWVRWLLAEKYFPNSPSPKSLEDMEAAVGSLHKTARSAVALLSATKGGNYLRNAFFLTLRKDAEACGGDLTTGVSRRNRTSTLKSAIDLMMPYLPKQLGAAVSVDTLERVLKAHPERVRKNSKR